MVEIIIFLAIFFGFLFILCLWAWAMNGVNEIDFFAYMKNWETKDEIEKKIKQAEESAKTHKEK